MKGEPHKKAIQTLQDMGICTESRKELDIPVPQADGSKTSYQQNVNGVVQDVLGAILAKAVWIADPNAVSQDSSNNVHTHGEWISS